MGMRGAARGGAIAASKDDSMNPHSFVRKKRLLGLLGRGASAMEDEMGLFMMMFPRVNDGCMIYSSNRQIVPLAA